VEKKVDRMVDSGASAVFGGAIQFPDHRCPQRDSDAAVKERKGRLGPEPVRAPAVVIE